MVAGRPAEPMKGNLAQTESQRMRAAAAEFRESQQDSHRELGSSRRTKREGSIEFLFFLPPTLYVADDWLSRGLAIGDTIINLASGLGGTPK